jgi:DNA-3-methyladenine glycosylase II
LVPGSKHPSPRRGEEVPIASAVCGRRIDEEADVAEALVALLAADPRLQRVLDEAGPVPLRRRSGGFEGLAHVITGQQISTHAAAAIWSRLRTAIDPFTPENFLAAREEVLRAAGQSRAKIATLTGIANACRDGLSLDALHDIPAEDAIAELVALKGIGRWTAESYLLFCVGHPDIFPAGDLALQSAVHQGLRLRKRPHETRLRAIAEKWSPWRGAAARLFWAYYRAKRGGKRPTA